MSINKLLDSLSILMGRSGPRAYKRAPITWFAQPFLYTVPSTQIVATARGASTGSVRLLDW